MVDLETVWQHREEVIYRNFFGGTGDGIYTLSPQIFQTIFRQQDVDPRWMFYGVFECPPTDTRKSWLYVTSSMTTPWDIEPSEYAQSEYSHIGVEFVLETPEQDKWPIEVLQRLMAYNTLLAYGRLGNTPVLDIGHRIPLGGSISMDKPSELCYVIAGEPSHYPSSFTLASGKVNFLHFAGITEAELAYGKQFGSEALINHLKQAGAFPITDPKRKSII